MVVLQDMFKQILIGPYYSTYIVITYLISKVRPTSIYLFNLDIV